MITIVIILITCAVSVLAFRSPVLLDKLIFNPYRVKNNKEWYRFITSGIIHADWIHLLVNMYVLYSFGGMVESYYKDVFGTAAGGYYFVLLYTGAIVISILPTYAKYHNHPGYNGLGASGATSAIIFTFVLFQPFQKICFYGVLCLPAVIMGILYLVYSYYMDKKNLDNINHGAHFWGAVFGFGFTLALEPGLFLYFIENINSVINFI